MDEDVEECLNKSQEAMNRMLGFKSDASFRDELEEKQIRLEQAMVEAFEAIYYQSRVIVQLLQGRGEG